MQLARANRSTGKAKIVTSMIFAAMLLAFGALAQANQQDEPIEPIPQQVHQDARRVALGRRLFYDTGLSSNGKIACASCHNLSSGGADDHARSLGIAGQQLQVNTPTVLNAALNFRQFWDGRANSLEAQIDLVVQNPAEMGSKWPDVLAKVGRDARYRADFANAYPDGVTKANIKHALASFERTLLTPNSRFDRYLRGEQDALSAIEKSGYAKFKQYGCVACHQGMNIGGNMYQKFGVMADYFASRGNVTAADLGRYNVTKDPEDRHVFKVPSLRNVALTAPYFHDGSAQTLEQAVSTMFKYQLGRIASPEDKRAIVQFLGTLTGETVGIDRAPRADGAP